MSERFPDYIYADKVDTAELWKQMDGIATECCSHMTIDQLMLLIELWERERANPSGSYTNRMPHLLCVRQAALQQLAERRDMVNEDVRSEIDRLLDN